MSQDDTHRKLCDGKYVWPGETLLGIWQLTILRKKDTFYLGKLEDIHKDIRA